MGSVCDLLHRSSYRHCSCYSEIIDVAALDSQPIEQHDYMDRARQYRWVLCGQQEKIAVHPLHHFVYDRCVTEKCSFSSSVVE